MRNMFRRLTKAFEGIRRDTQGVAAVEFAWIVPIMIVLLFGLIEITSGVATNRKVSMATRTLSDLVSQGASTNNTDMLAVFIVGGYVMQPYDSAPMTATVSQIMIGADKKATITWSKSATYSGTGQTVAASLTNSSYTVGQTITVPDALATAPSYPTYLIKSEVKYTYTPMLLYVIKNNVFLADDTYTRPRQSSCVAYSGVC
jgi:Flp pilus assembly protein TadG